MKPIEQSIFNLRKYITDYFQKWRNIYKRWEFWAMASTVIGTLTVLDVSGLSTDNFQRNHKTIASLATLIIMLPMPYILRRTKAKTHGRNKEQARILRSITLSIPYAISGILVLSALSFCLPIFIDTRNSLPLSGLQLMLQHPIAVATPALYLMSARMAFKDYRDLRIVILLWTVGGYFAMLAVAIAYTNIDVDVAKNFEWAFLLAFFLPIAVITISLFPLKAPQA
jgi:hypothetical protein